MKEIIIATQEELDKLQRVEIDERVIIDNNLVLNCELEVFGTLIIKAELQCDWFNNRYIVARENSSPSIVTWGNSSPSIEAQENSSPSIVAQENSSPSIVAQENSSPSIVAQENSSPSIVAWENSSPSIVTWGNSSPSIEARENSSPSIVTWGNSSPSIVAQENSSPSIVAWGSSIIRLLKGLSSVILNGYSVLSIPVSLKVKIKKSKTAIVQRYKPETKYFQREGIQTKDGKVVLYKRVSHDYKTQEDTSNETKWEVGSIVTHPNWKPKNAECGEGKFHACSKPYFCDEFRGDKGDKYVAIEIKTKDLYEWKNPDYPHKIAFREGEVLYECDRFGRRLK